MPKQAVIDAHFWGETDQVEIRSDLAHTHIYICAPEVLMLFSDNFDYQVGPTPRQFLECKHSQIVQLQHHNIGILECKMSSRPSPAAVHSPLPANRSSQQPVCEHTVS